MTNEQNTYRDRLIETLWDATESGKVPKEDLLWDVLNWMNLEQLQQIRDAYNNEIPY